MQKRLKQERIVEAVRQGLDGDAAVLFIRQSGYAMTPTGLARSLKAMGGRQKVEGLIEEGKTNVEVLQACFEGEDLSQFPVEPPAQRELFPEEAVLSEDLEEGESGPLYESAKLTLRIPRDLYEAIRIAARAERKPQNQLIVEILTAALSRLPEFPPPDAAI